MTKKHIGFKGNNNFVSGRLRPTKERYLLKRQFIDLLGGKCIDCGYKSHLAALDFDHINPKIKVCGVSTLLSCSDYSHEEILNEALKCVIRCANCHRIKTNPTATD